MKGLLCFYWRIPKFFLQSLLMFLSNSWHNILFVGLNYVPGCKIRLRRTYFGRVSELYSYCPHEYWCNTYMHMVKRNSGSRFPCCDSSLKKKKVSNFIQNISWDAYLSVRTNYLPLKKKLNWLSCKGVMVFREDLYDTRQHL